MKTKITAYLPDSVKQAMKYARSVVQWKRLSFSASPIVFANSMPKSGSHLILQIMQGLTQVAPLAYVRYQPIRSIARDGRVRSSEEVVSDLRQLKPGEVGWGYLNAASENIAVVCRPNWVNYFIIRDPRDMLVSHVFFATDMFLEHGMHDYYRKLPNVGARLRVAIRGVDEQGIFLPNVGERYGRMLGWLEHREVLTLRFEDLISNRAKTIDGMLLHFERFGVPVSLPYPEARRRIMAAIQPGKSATFRKGKAGGWREHFTPEIKKMFKDISGDLLINLGYEKNNDW